jgi:hypothetical protein
MKEELSELHRSLWTPRSEHGWLFRSPVMKRTVVHPLLACSIFLRWSVS